MTAMIHRLAKLPSALRVLHLNSMLKGGGTDDQCLKLVQGLRGLGETAWLAGPDARDFSRVVRSMGLPFVVTPPEGPAKLRFILSAARFVRQERIQIVHGHHGRDLWPTIMAAHFSGAHPRIVLTRHMAKSPSSWVSRRFLLGQCHALTAVSEFVARVLREGVYEPASPEPERRARPPLVGDLRKIQVLYGGIDTGRFRPSDATEQRRAWGLRPEDVAFAVVGGYDLPRGKGQREFLRAAALIQVQAPHARFLIVGRGNMARILQDDIAQLGLQGKAWLTPWCADMPLAMNALDCLVHPQIGTEAFGLVLLEAFACGKPVIASALDGIPEAFATGAYGQLVEPESIPELAAAMLHWACQTPLPESERQRLHARIAGPFSLDAAALRMREFYRTLLGNSDAATN